MILIFLGIMTHIVKINKNMTINIVNYKIITLVLLFMFIKTEL